MPITENKTAPFIQKGSVSFIVQKTMNIIFLFPFNVIPSVDLTLGDENLTPPYRINVTKNGFIIKFKVNYTGDLEWKATDPRIL